MFMIWSVIWRLTKRVMRRIEVASELVAEGFVFILMLLMIAEIIGRSVFNHPIVGHYETVSLLLLGIVYLGVGYTQSERANIRVELAISWVKGRKRELLDGLVLFLALIFFGFLFWATGREALISWKIKEYLPGQISFPIWPGKFVIPLGILMLCLRLLIQILEHLGGALHRYGESVQRSETMV